MRKSILISILAMLIVIALAACGNGGNNSAPAPQQQPTPPTTTQTLPPSASDADTTEDNAADVATPPEVDPAVYAEEQRLWEEFYELATAMSADPSNDFFFNIFRAWESRNAERYEEFGHGDASEFIDMSDFEQFLWVDTYLRLVENLHQGAFDAFFGSTTVFLNTTVGAQITAISRQCEDTAAAYEALMLWQYDYIHATSTVFNFVVGANHRDITGTDFDPTAAGAEWAAAEQALVEQELQEIADEIDGAVNWW